LKLRVQVWKPREPDTLEDIALLAEDQLETVAESNQKVLVKSFHNYAGSAGLMGWEAVAGATPFLQCYHVMNDMELQLWQAGST